MNPPSCRIDGASIVLVGSFNPAIFQPSWLAMQGLLRKESVDTAKVNVISSEVTDFEMDWVQFVVTTDRLTASTVDPSQWNPLRDVVLGIFSLLEHTPLARMGLNRLMDYEMPDQDQWHELGNRLAPKEMWKDLIEEPGMRSLTIEGRRKGSEAKYFRVMVEPSVKVTPGVFVQTNEHYEAGNSTTLMGYLKSSWEEAQAFAKQVAERLVRHTQ